MPRLDSPQHRGRRASLAAGPAGRVSIVRLTVARFAITPRALLAAALLAIALLAAACDDGDTDATDTGDTTGAGVAVGSDAATSSGLPGAEAGDEAPAGPAVDRPAPGALGGDLPPAEPTTTYRDEAYRVAFDYPQAWTRSPDHLLQFDGPGGFVQVDAMANGGRGLDDAVAALAQHKLRPYGSQPLLQEVTVDGASAVLILPSEDQSPPGGDPPHVAVVIPRTGPVTVNGVAYEYTVLYADLAHIDRILASLRLLPPA